MASVSKTSKIGIVSIIAGLLLLGFLFFYTADWAGGRFTSGGTRLAQYPNFTLKSSSSRYTSDPREEMFCALSTSASSFGNIASLYIELPNGKRRLLSDLQEEEVVKLYIKDTDLSDETKNCYKCNVGRNAMPAFKFRDGKLVYARFESGFPLCPKISLTKEGPYLKLPIDRETMLKTFGKPKRWSTRKSSNRWG